MRACQITCGAKLLSSHRHTAFNRRVGAVRHDQLRERRDTRALLSRQPDKSWTKVRSILIQIPPEERCHEQRHYGHWLAKMGEFRLQPQIRLIVAISVDG